MQRRDRTGVPRGDRRPSGLGWAVVLGAAVAACAECSMERPRWVPPDRNCPGALRPVWVADSSLTICVVTSFRTRDLQTWTRERAGSAPDTFELRMDVGDIEAGIFGWPPTLGSAAERVVAHADTIAGFPGRMQTGWLRPPEAGSRARSAFIAGWSTDDARRGMARGSSESRLTLDTLLLMLRSAQPWRPPAKGGSGPRS